MPSTSWTDMYGTGERHTIPISFAADSAWPTTGIAPAVHFSSSGNTSFNLSPQSVGSTVGSVTVSPTISGMTPPAGALNGIPSLPPSLMSHAPSTNGGPAAAAATTTGPDTATIQRVALAAAAGALIARSVWNYVAAKRAARASDEKKRLDADALVAAAAAAAGATATSSPVSTTSTRPPALRDPATLFTPPPQGVAPGDATAGEDFEDVAAWGDAASPVTPENRAHLFPHRPPAAATLSEDARLPDAGPTRAAWTRIDDIPSSAPVGAGVPASEPTAVAFSPSSRGSQRRRGDGVYRGNDSVDGQQQRRESVGRQHAPPVPPQQQQPTADNSAAPMTEMPLGSRGSEWLMIR